MDRGTSFSGLRLHAAIENRIKPRFKKISLGEVWRLPGFLDGPLKMGENRNVPHGGVLVSTLQVRQRRHAEDGSWASLKIGPNKTANQELALAA